MASLAPGSNASASQRHSRSRRGQIAIWWQEIDRATLLMVFLLMAIGSVAVAAASPASAKRLSTASETLSQLHFFLLHMRWQFMGLLVMFFASRLNKKTARRAGVLLSGAMLFALVLVPIVGSEVNGAKRWLNLGLSLQPSEFLKCGFPILLAWIMSWRTRDHTMPVMTVCFAVMALLGVLLMLQPDFGSTMLFAGTFMVMICLGGVPLKRIGALFGAGVAVIVLMYFTYENGRNRIDSFLFGGTAFDQVDLAERTILNGGWTGLGFWMGTRKMSLPEAHTDYIFSVIGEEFGLIACVIIIMVYFAILMTMILRVMEEEDLFTVLAGSGFAAQFGGQAFINILVNLQLFPSKGMTLPLISYGGSSTVAICLSMGLMLAITRRNPFLAGDRFIFGRSGDKS